MKRRFCSAAHRQIAEWACPQGWDWKITQAGHIQWRHPRVKRAIYTSATPSDCHAVVKAKAVFRRISLHTGSP